MNANEAIKIVKATSSGRARVEGQEEPFMDEVLVAEIERLRSADKLRVTEIEQLQSINKDFATKIKQLQDYISTTLASMMTMSQELKEPKP